MQQPIDESGRTAPYVDPTAQPVAPDPFAAPPITATPVANPPRAFGPMQPVAPVANPPRVYGPVAPTTPTATAPVVPPDTTLEDRIVARLAAMLGQSMPINVSPAPTDLPPEDQRLISALAGVHPAGRDVRILSRDQVATNLFFVEYTFAPATGTLTTVQSLVYDNGERTHVFGGR